MAFSSYFVKYIFIYAFEHRQRESFVVYILENTTYCLLSNKSPPIVLQFTQTGIILKIKQNTTHIFNE